jgi:hypothetical protein
MVESVDNHMHLAVLLGEHPARCDDKAVFSDRKWLVGERDQGSIKNRVAAQDESQQIATEPFSAVLLFVWLVPGPKSKNQGLPPMPSLQVCTQRLGLIHGLRFKKIVLVEVIKI